MQPGMKTMVTMVTGVLVFSFLFHCHFWVVLTSVLESVIIYKLECMENSMACQRVSLNMIWVQLHKLE